MSKSEFPSEQVADYITGELLQQDAVEFAYSLEKDSTLKAEVLALQKKWNHHSVPQKLCRDGVDAAWKIVAARLEIDSSVPKEAGDLSRILPQNSHVKVWISVFAGFLSFLLVFIGWHLGTNLVITDLSNQASVYSTGYGQQAAILLPDGTKAMLNVGSELRVPADYATGNRTIHLTGEAIFTVISQSQSPFTVNADSHSIRVLGTKFLVRRYATDTTTLVAVKSGKVQVDETVLSGMQKASFSDPSQATVTVATEAGFTFESGILTLEDVSLNSAMERLSRWYNAEIRVSDPGILNMRLNGAYAFGSIGDLVEILELTLGVKVERKGRTLTLHSL